jgi:sugar lactone lactonase YvrE
MKKFLSFILFLSIAGSIEAQSIKFTENELYPEGIDYNTREKCFYVSSLHYGKIGKVSTKGEYSTFIDDPEIPSAIGLRVDIRNSQLIVCGSDPGVSTKTDANNQRKLAKVGFYDLYSGKRKAIVDLGKLNTNSDFNFANDIAIGKDGSVYVTNSFSPIIYVIDPKTYQAKVLLNDAAFAAKGFGLNGIATLKNGYIVTCNSEKGELFILDPKTPKAFNKIEVSGDFKGVDGIVANGDDELIIICNSQQKIFRLSSDNNFRTAKVTGEVKSVQTFPTTGVRVGEKYYVLNAKLNEIFTPKATLSSDFIIQEISF